MGITFRITVMSWTIALTTLLVFVLMIIPQQQKMFFSNLQAKAGDVAVSLHNMAAGAAINEDFACVVIAAQALLAGDPELEFLTIMKNDGFALVIEQGKWKRKLEVDAFWMPSERKAAGFIGKVPGFNRRVFHYSQPLDHADIEWGWIHVGLSLKKYDQNVVTLYRNTALTALTCAALSLLVSVIYSRRLVQPILRLRRYVRRIAGGDLSVRTDITRSDELGSLAASVDAMTQALLRRDRILESVRFAAQTFMQTSQWEDGIVSVLDKIGQAAVAHRACIFKNKCNDEGRLYASRQFQWTAPGFSFHQRSPDRRQRIYGDEGFALWVPILGANKIISGPVSQMNPAQRARLITQGTFSLIVIPIFVKKTWWGVLELEDCIRGRQWTEPEKDSLRAAADMLGATIVRQRTREALLEAKSTLEQRVRKRTRELEAQVIAKEEALTELAAAQSSLLKMSHAAGMAKVATDVLHNVGNVLNSVNVSCDLIMDQLRESRVSNVARVSALIMDSGNRLDKFFMEDPRGQKIPAYLASLAPVLEQENQLMVHETRALHNRIGHIKEIVSMQQTYSRVSGVLETLPPEQLVEDALNLNAESLSRHEITVLREYRPVPTISVEKHKVLQIFLNLLNNAKQSCTEHGGKDKTITLRIFNCNHDRLTIQIADNGMGIPPDNLTRIFQHGFTTRKSGHGFGLHSGALAAKELGGSLTAHSDGLGRGATFTVTLPYHPDAC